MKQAHDEILEKWLEEEISISKQSLTNTAGDAYDQGCYDTLRAVKDKLEELWREK